MIYLNSCSFEELKTIPHIGESKASKIVDLRSTVVLSPEILSGEGVLNIDKWNELLNTNIVSFDVGAIEVVSVTPTHSCRGTSGFH